MAMQYCFECDRLLDGDWIEFCEWEGDNEICIDCHMELTPENYEDWEVFYWAKPIPDRNHDWEITHKNYDGEGDHRHFTGPTLSDVWSQAKEYEEDDS